MNLHFFTAPFFIKEIYHTKKRKENNKYRVSFLIMVK